MTSISTPAETGTNRDELALELFIGDNFNQPREASIADWEWFLEKHRSSSRVEHYFTMANTVIAAGYREPRTITTVEELEALPVGSVILDIDLDAWQRYSTGWTCTDRAANTVDQPSVNLVNILGPATVVWEPGA